MKRYENSRYSYEKQRAQQWKREHDGGGFRCSHCRQFVILNDMLMGTANRNHCNWCLWSKHVDVHKGDRRSNCQSGMKPIGLTFRHEGFGKRGEIILIHLCSSCAKLSINRVARDDPTHGILEVFGESFNLAESLKRRLTDTNIELATEIDRNELHIQLFGS